MQPKRNLRFDFLAVLLAGATIFLALALFTFNPADSAGDLVYPAQEVTSNVCGPAGATISLMLFNACGVGAYYIVLSMAGADWTLFTHRWHGNIYMRLLGWGLSFVGVTTLGAMLFPDFSPGTVVGPGGYLGAAGQAFLEGHFAAAGAYVLLLGMILGGLLLCSDYWCLRIASRCLMLPVKGSLFLAVLAHEFYSAWKNRGPAGEGEGDEGEARKAIAVNTARGKIPLPAAAKTDKQIDGKELADHISIKRPSRTAQPIAESLESLKSSLKNASLPQGGEKNLAVAEEGERGDEEAAEIDASADAASEGVPDEVDGEEIEASKGAMERVNDALKFKPPSPEALREAIKQEIDEASKKETVVDYKLPTLDMLTPGEHFAYEEQEKEIRRKAKILEKTFADFGFNIRVVEVETGPVIAQYEVELEAGLRLSKITGLADDLAIALRVPSVRIVAPIPGKNTVGIEVPNAERQLVRLREVIEESASRATKMRIPIYLGKDVSGNPLVIDLATLPHLLIAGRTGTGKSVCLNTIIMSMLMARSPEDIKMLLIDPKMVELSPYMRLPHLMHPVVTDMKKAEAILAWAVDKMEERYALLARAGVRHISVYNQLDRDELYDRMQPESEEEKASIPTHLPYIVIVADEMADLMMTSAKEVETHIIRLAQKSRAVGIHLVLATQKPTVDVITGLIKSNLPARISFQVSSRTDSRVVLDEMGADKLLGNGDLLFLWPGTSTLIRGQGAYVGDEEINRVVSFVGTTAPQFVTELVQLPAAGQNGEPVNWKSRDELYEGAVEVVVSEGRGSVSLLQRTMGIGYGRAARLIDFMAEDGIVGQYNGSQAREVLITPEEWAQMAGRTEVAVPPPPPPLPATRSKAVSIIPGESEPFSGNPIAAGAAPYGNTPAPRVIRYKAGDDEPWEPEEGTEGERDEEVHRLEDEDDYLADENSDEEEVLVEENEDEDITTAIAVDEIEDASEGESSWEGAGETGEDEEEDETDGEATAEDSKLLDDESSDDEQAAAREDEEDRSAENETPRKKSPKKSSTPSETLGERSPHVPSPKVSPKVGPKAGPKINAPHGKKEVMRETEIWNPRNPKRPK